MHFLGKFGKIVYWSPFQRKVGNPHFGEIVDPTTDIEFSQNQFPLNERISNFETNEMLFWAK